MAESNIGAYVYNGSIQESTASSNSLSSSSSSSSSSLDKDAFLQLLVAQMKYQDPLEPTENTEYISQLATFSQLEEMQNLSSTMSFQRAGSLVGQEVVCKVTNSKTGNTEVVTGMVDYVVYENNKAYVSIADSLYSVDDVYEVVNPSYSAAYELAQNFNSALATLPKLDQVTLENETVVSNLRTAYNSMSAYEKTFISQESLSALEQYEAKIKSLKAAAEDDKE